MTDLPKQAKSLWRESYEHPLYASLASNITVDVAIIGAGITGLTSAYLLKKAGATVAVVDKASVGGGTTGRTTGKITSQHGLLYAGLEKRFGAETARTYADANQAAVEKVVEIVASEQIDCGLEREDNYVYTTDPRQTETFRQEAQVAFELGLPATFETTSPLPFEITGAVKFSSQARMNAQQYVLGLASKVNGTKSYVFEHSNVTRIHYGKPCKISTKGGSITAKDIIVATNVPTLPLMARVTYCTAEYPTESYIVAGRLPQEMAGMYISPDKENYSILPIQFGGKPYVLIGGESHISGLRGSTTRRFERLAKYAQERFGVTEITHRWSDRDYLPYDNVPLIGKLYPWSQHLYVGTAYKKWGLSNGTVAGMILSDRILGKSNAWADTFTPHRLSAPASIPRVVLAHLTGKR